jgi:hypothetical protein
VDRALARRAAGGLAAARVTLGVVAYAAPALPARPWIGDAASRTTATTVLARALGARDLGLGAGLLLAARHGAPTRGWVEAGALADLGDLVATLLSFRELPRGGRWLILAVTAGAVAAGRLLAAEVD